MLIGLVKFLFWFFIVSYLFKILARFFAPILIKHFFRKMSNRFNQDHHKNHHSSHKEGEVTIEKNVSKQSKSDHIGDYVDYEEIDE